MRRVVYLLGAGAMIDFDGPKTCELTGICADILKKHHCESILFSLDATYGKGNYNFETIIASIEFLMDWAVAHERQGYISVDNTNVIVSIMCSKYQSFNSDQLLLIYEELINCIIERVSKYDYNFSHKPEHNVLKCFFKNDFEKKIIKIYSLNYDRLIPHLFGNSINDGTMCSSDFFSYNLKQFINYKQSYFNLHGSIYLKKEIDQTVLSYKVRQCGIPQSLTYVLEQEGGSPNDRKIFSPIIAGYSKSQRMLGEPFNFGLGVFMEDCSLCDELIIVGYSFSDPHINSIIRNYSKFGNIDIIIVDKKDVSIIKQDLTSKFHVVHPFREDNGSSYNRDDKIRIYTNGFLDYMNIHLKGVCKQWI
jgi:hypothetical protein